MHPENPDRVRLPVLPLRDVGIQSGQTLKLFVGRPKSIAAVTTARSRDNRILLVAQRDPQREIHHLSDLSEFGTICTLLEVLKLPDGTHKIAVRGEEVCRLSMLQEDGTHYTAEVSIVTSATDQELGISPSPSAIERPDDIINELKLTGFDPGGEPVVRVERSGSLWLVFSHMPPTWVPETEYQNFGRFAGFDKELAEAIGCGVIWDDREFFYIERPMSDTAERVRRFLLDYRHRNEHG